MEFHFAQNSTRDKQILYYLTLVCRWKIKRLNEHFIIKQFLSWTTWFYVYQLPHSDSRLSLLWYIRSPVVEIVEHSISLRTKQNQYFIIPKLTKSIHILWYWPKRNTLHNQKLIKQEFRLKIHVPTPTPN